MLKTANMTAWWPLDGNANDYSGNGNNGSVSGAVPAAGMFGQAYSFDGTDDSINVGAGMFATGKHAQGTCAAWVKINVVPSSQSGNYKYPAIWNKGNVYGSFAVKNNMKLIVYYYDGSEQSFESNAVLNTAQWYHVAAAWNADGSTIYINGIADAQNSLTWTNMNDGGSAENMLIGRTTAYAVLNGLIGNLIFWDRVLSVEQIKRVMLNLHPF